EDPTDPASALLGGRLVVSASDDQLERPAGRLRQPLEERERREGPTALDLGDGRLGGSHGFGELSLSEPRLLAPASDFDAETNRVHTRDNIYSLQYAGKPQTARGGQGPPLYLDVSGSSSVT